MFQKRPILGIKGVQVAAAVMEKKFVCTFPYDLPMAGGFLQTNLPA
jgi:hypothetical protein